MLLPLSCAKIEMAPEAVSGDPIRFTVGAYAPTKSYASPSDGGLVKELKALGVAEANLTFKTSAWLHSSVEGKQNFMNAEPITYDGTAPCSWSPSRDFFWPKASTSYVNFASWYDYTAATPTLTYTESASVWNVSISWPNRVVQAKDDILYADVAWRFNGNPTSAQNNSNEAAALADTDTSFGKDGVTEGVPTLFHHALAQVLFKAKVEKIYKGESRIAAADNTDKLGTYWDVTLGTVTISSKVKNTGTLTLTQTDKGSKGIKPYGLPANSIWTPASMYAGGTATSSDYSSFSLGYASILTTSAVDIMDGGMPEHYQAVMPQHVGDDITITITYVIDTYYCTEAQFTGGSKASYKKTTETVTTDALQLNEDEDDVYWQMNKRYTYTLIIDPETTLIKFDPAVASWASPSYTIDL